MARNRIGTFQYGTGRIRTAVARPIITYGFIGTGGVGAYFGRDAVAGPILADRIIAARLAAARIPIFARQRTFRGACSAIEIGITIASAGIFKIYTVRRYRFPVANLRAILRSVIRTILRIRLACRRNGNLYARKPILALAQTVAGLLTGSSLAAASSAELYSFRNLIILGSRTRTGPLPGYVFAF